MAYTDTYLNKLGRVTSMNGAYNDSNLNSLGTSKGTSPSYYDSRLSTYGIYTPSQGYQDSYLSRLGRGSNPNQTYADDSLISLGKITLDSYYTPIKKIINHQNMSLSNHTKITAPPGYLACKILIFHGGQQTDELPILFPQSLSESLSTNFVKESPIGSTIPIVAFSNTQPHQINTSFIMTSDYLPTGFRSLKDYIDRLKWMLKPRYNGSGVVLSPSVQFTFANMIITGVCDSLSVDYKDVYGNNSFVHATGTCGFTVTGGV